MRVCSSMRSKYPFPSHAFFFLFFWLKCQTRRPSVLLSLSLSLILSDSLYLSFSLFHSFSFIHVCLYICICISLYARLLALDVCRLRVQAFPRSPSLLSSLSTLFLSPAGNNPGYSSFLHPFHRSRVHTTKAVPFAARTDDSVTRGSVSRQTLSPSKVLCFPPFSSFPFFP